MKKKEKTAFLKEVRKRYDDGVSFDHINRDEARSDLDFLAGKQWDDLTRLEREADNRLMLTENRLPLFVSQVVGEIRQQRPSIRVRGVDDASDKNVAEIMTGLIRDIEAGSATRQPIIRAAESAVQCGIGHFRILTDYSDADSFNQDILMTPIHDPFAVVWDPDAELVTREDAMWCFVTTEMSREAFKRRFPKAEMNDFNIDEPYTEYSENWSTKDGVIVAEYWVKEPYTRKLALTQEGDIIDVTESTDDELAQYVDVRERETYRVKMYKVTASEVLEEQDWPTAHIPIIPVIGEQIQLQEGVQRRGVIRFAKDSQRLLNYWNTTRCEWMALQPKAPFIATAKQVEGFEADWANANDTRESTLLYNGDPLASGEPKRSMPPNGSAAFNNDIVLAQEALKATTGINDAGLGMQGNETSGRAIRERKMQASTATYAYTDNLARSVEHAGKILVDLIPKIYDTARTIRVMGEDGVESYQEINSLVIEDGVPVVKNDLSVGRYDIHVSTGPAYATRRSEAAESMIQFIQTAPNAAGLVMDLIADNMDWPKADEFAARLKKGLPPGIVEPDDDDEEAQQAMAAQMQAAQEQAELAKQAAMLDLENKQLENAKIKAEIINKQADAEETKADTLLTQIEARLKALEMSLAMQGPSPMMPPQQAYISNNSI